MELTLKPDEPPAEASPVTPLEELLRLAADPRAREEFSALGPHKYLLIDAWAGDLPSADAQRLVAWLRDLPCPVLGIEGPGDAGDPLRGACDALVQNIDAAWPLIGNIERTPIAASVLVQTLRATAALPIAEALIVESLAYATLQAGPEFRAWLASNRDTFKPAPAEAGPAILIERDGAALSLMLNRPAHRNAMNREMRDALVEALQLVVADASIVHVTLSGRGRCFSTGGDLAEFGTAPDPATGHAVRGLALPARLLAQCATRVACRVHGACIGAGIELPAFAVRVVAGEDAYFQLPELRFGLIPGAGGCVGVARRIGRQRTAWMVLSGKRVNARQALDWGLVDALERRT